jgi:serine/threonine protein kinase
VIELSEHVIEALGKDKEFNLYRGRNKGDNSHVLVLSPLAEYPAPETLKRLEHEYSLREELDPTWAARAMAITRHWGRTVLVLEDPGGVPLDQLLGQTSDLAFSLRLAVGLSGVIERLHRCGIIHKDIKPANVLDNCATARCWLKGFGIASQLVRERQSAGSPELVAGTLAYMAPEQTGRMNRSVDCQKAAAAGRAFAAHTGRGFRHRNEAAGEDDRGFVHNEALANELAARFYAARGF